MWGSRLKLGVLYNHDPSQLNDLLLNRSPTFGDSSVYAFGPILFFKFVVQFRTKFYLFSRIKKPIVVTDK
jgi:hypothetical protein